MSERSNAAPARTSDEGLLAWQWRLYQDGHRDRTNLLIHVLTQPIFVAGLATIVIGPLAGAPWLAAIGVVAMVLAIALQGRGHRGETTAPVPFRGPGDVVARLVVEQLITWPRYLLSGQFAAAWQRAGQR